MTAVSVVRKPADLATWYGNDSVYHVLETHGLTHGYSTDYWYANSITVLSESRINVLCVKVTEAGFEIGDFQNKGSWYKETPKDETTFLICPEWEVNWTPWMKEDIVEKTVEVLHATQYLPDQPYGFFILVFDHDIIAEKLQENEPIVGIDAQVSEK